MKISKRINRLVADKSDSVGEKLGDDRDRADVDQGGKIDPVAKVYGCLGYTIDTNAMMAQLRGRHN